MEAPRSSSWVVRIGTVVAAALCIGVALIDIDDQGGIVAFHIPSWLGWAYRLLEVGGVVVAVALLAGRALKVGVIASMLVGLGPLAGFVLSRTSGLPADSDDVGNWGERLGIVSVVVESALVMVALLVFVRLVSRQARNPEQAV